jgi:hypothetical protein
MVRWFCTIAVTVVFLAAPAAQARTLFGFTPFPYDATAEALSQVGQLLRDNASIHALHFDDGVPWEEMLANQPLPDKVQREWNDAARTAPAGRPLYLALTPLAKDRKSLAPGLGGKDGGLPWSLKLAPLDDKKVKAAYLEYVRRAVQHFRPTYLNIGIEAGELASRDAGSWPKYESLYLYVVDAIKREFPKVQVGMSFGLQALRKPEVAKRAKRAAEASDYVCVSFYPHASPFGERFGDPALGAGEMAWREPLDWLRNYTRKPLAVCETGYSTRTVTLKSFDNLTLRGDVELQQRYVRELAQIAQRDSYLFVVWFLAVDYDRLYERLGGDKPSNEVNLLWRNIGLWDGEMRPKPALREWQTALAGSVTTEAAPAATPPAQVVPAVPAVAPARPVGFEVGFSQVRQLFEAGPGSRMSLDDGGALWSYEYRRNDWAWALRDLGGRLPATTTRMVMRMRSDRAGALFIQLQDGNGQTFFAMVEPSREWSEVTLDFSSMQPDPAKRKGGVLRPSAITKLLIADAAGRDRAEGRRNVWMAEWRFE